MFDTDYSGYMRTLTSLSGTRYQFEPGCFALELLVTGGPGPGQAYEILHSADDLVAWLRESRLAETAPLTDLRVRPAEFVRVKHFRDRLWSVAKAVADGQAPAPADLEVLNDCAEPPPRPRVDPITGERSWVGPVTGAQILGAAAREAIDLVTTDLGERVRECGGENCYLIFLDTSRPGTRRWCSMQRCGNRHKVKAYRSRP